MGEIIDKSLNELKETANALRITYAPSITKTQLQKLLLKDLKDDQSEREAFANKKERRETFYKQVLAEQAERDKREREQAMRAATQRA